MARRTTSAKTPKPSSSATKSTATKATARKSTTTASKLAAGAKSTREAVLSAVIDAPEPKVVKVAEPVVAEPELKKRELVDLVVERSGVKKKDAKPTVEALLAILGETIAAGRELNLSPMGKLRINRVEEKGNGRVVICKLRQSTAIAKSAATDAEATQKPALAEPAE